MRYWPNHDSPHFIYFLHFFSLSFVIPIFTDKRITLFLAKPLFLRKSYLQEQLLFLLIHNKHFPFKSYFIQHRIQRSILIQNSLHLKYQVLQHYWVSCYLLFHFPYHIANFICYIFVWVVVLAGFEEYICEINVNVLYCKRNILVFLLCTVLKPEDLWSCFVIIKYLVIIIGENNAFMELFN